MQLDHRLAAKPVPRLGATTAKVMAEAPRFVAHGAQITRSAWLGGLARGHPAGGAMCGGAAGGAGGEGVAGNADVGDAAGDVMRDGDVGEGVVGDAMRQMVVPMVTPIVRVLQVTLWVMVSLVVPTVRVPQAMHRVMAPPFVLG